MATVWDLAWGGEVGDAGKRADAAEKVPDELIRRGKRKGSQERRGKRKEGKGTGKERETGKKRGQIRKGPRQARQGRTKEPPRGGDHTSEEGHPRRRSTGKDRPEDDAWLAVGARPRILVMPSCTGLGRACRGGPHQAHQAHQAHQTHQGT